LALSKISAYATLTVVEQISRRHVESPVFKQDKKERTVNMVSSPKEKRHKQHGRVQRSVGTVGNNHYWLPWDAMAQPQPPFQCVCFGIFSRSRSYGFVRHRNTGMRDSASTGCQVGDEFPATATRPRFRNPFVLFLG